MLPTIPFSAIGSTVTAAVTAAKKQGLLEKKKPGLLSQVGGFLGETLAAYQTARATPATITPAPITLVSPAPASSGTLLSPTVVIVGAAALGFLLLRQR